MMVQIPKNEYSLLEATHRVHVSAKHPSGGEYNGEWVVKGKDIKDAIYKAHKRWMDNGWQISGIKTLKEDSNEDVSTHVKKDHPREWRQIQMKLKEEEMETYTVEDLEQLDEISQKSLPSYHGFRVGQVVKIDSKHPSRSSFDRTFNFKAKTAGGWAAKEKRPHTQGIHQLGVVVGKDDKDDHLQVAIHRSNYGGQNYSQAVHKGALKPAFNEDVENYENELLEEAFGSYLQDLSEEDREETLKFLEEGTEEEVDDFLTELSKKTLGSYKALNRLTKEEQEPYSNLIDAIASEDVVKSNDILTSILSQKVLDAVEGKRYEMAQQLFGVEKPKEVEVDESKIIEEALEAYLDGLNEEDRESYIQFLNEGPDEEVDEFLTELSKKTLGSYINKASFDVMTRALGRGRMYNARTNRERDDAKSLDPIKKTKGNTIGTRKDLFKRQEGIQRAVYRLASSATSTPGGYVGTSSRKGFKFTK